MQPDATTENEIRDACQKHEFRTASLHAIASHVELFGRSYYTPIKWYCQRRTKIKKPISCGETVERMVITLYEQ